MRTLLDTGASFSIVSSQLASRIPYAKISHNKHVNLCGVTGTHLNIKGTTDISFDMGNQCITHSFIVCDNIAEQMILGTDFLKKFEVEISYKNRTISLNNETIQLDNHKYLTSLVKAARNTKIKPNSTTICFVKARQQRHKISKKEFLISRIDSGMLANEPGIYAADGLVTINSIRKFPIAIVNSTNRHINIKKGTMIAQLEEIDSICSFKQTILEELKGEIGANTSDETTTQETNIPLEYKQPLDELINEFNDLFSTGPTDVGKTDLMEMTIDLEHDRPINVYPYRIPIHKRATVEEEVQNMLKAGIVRHSNSPYNAPAIVVRKKSGKIRLVVDFRSLNRITRPIAQPLENIDDILASLSGAKFITTLDIKSAYHTIPIKEEDIPKTGFSVLQHHLEYTRAAFGLRNSGIYFNKLMSKILSGIKGSFVHAYADDLIIASKSFREHIRHLREVFGRFRHACIKLNYEKCFIQARTEYLGHTITQDGIEPSKDKVKALLDTPKPTSIKAVRSLLGFASYYRRYFPNFAMTCEPLINLTRKNVKFDWNDECDKAFETIKNALLNPPILAFPDPNKRFILYTDASDKAIGAVLKQEYGNIEKTVHYLSHSLSRTQQRWPIIEKECFAIIHSIDKLNHILADTPIPFIIRTDHKPLESLLNSKQKNRKLQMWAILLSAYNYKIEFINGSRNLTADYMSRYAIRDDKHHTVNAINSDRLDLRAIHSPSDADSSHLEIDRDPPPTLDLPGDFDIIAAQEADPAIRKIKQQLSHNTASEHVKAHHSVIDNILYYISSQPTHITVRLVIPKTLQKIVLQQLHDNNSHLGVTKTSDLISKRYYWRNMFQDVADHVTRCVTCSTRRINTNKTPMQNTDIPSFCFEKISIDIVGPLPKTTSGNSYILTVFDLFSSYPEAIPIPDKSAETVAKVLIRDIFTRYSCPLEILSDSGLEFRNKLMRDINKHFNINHIFCSPYRPQSNSKCERFHRILNDSLAKHMYVSKNTDWDEVINFVLSAIRTSTSAATKYSPHFIVFKQDPIMPLDTLLRPRNKYFGDEQHKIDLEQMHIAYTAVRDNIAHSQEKRLARENKNATLKEFEINDPVYIFNNARKNKCDIRWKPYYRVIRKTSPRSYIVRDMITGKLYRSHIQHMKEAKLQWTIPPPARPLRRARLAYPRENQNQSSSQHNSSQSDVENDSYEADTENSDTEQLNITSDEQQSVSDTQLSIKSNEKQNTQVKQHKPTHVSHTSENSTDDNSSTPPSSHHHASPLQTRRGRRIIKPARFRGSDAINCISSHPPKHQDALITINSPDTVPLQDELSKTDTNTHTPSHKNTHETFNHDNINTHEGTAKTVTHRALSAEHNNHQMCNECTKPNTTPHANASDKAENLSVIKLELINKMLSTLSTIG